jgi:hypothetical protein
MKQYIVKKIELTDIKYFSISVGLLPGYDNAKQEYSVSIATTEFNKWIQERLENNQYVFAAKVIPISFMYGFKNKGDIIINNNEKAIEFQGEVIREYCIDFDNDRKLLTIISELASRIGNTCKQERVHIMFNNQKYILE